MASPGHEGLHDNGGQIETLLQQPQGVQRREGHIEIPPLRRSFKVNDTFELIET